MKEIEDNLKSAMEDCYTWEFAKVDPKQIFPEAIKFIDNTKYLLAWDSIQDVASNEDGDVVSVGHSFWYHMAQALRLMIEE